MAPEVASLPCPGFEGFEKRLEVHFSSSAAAADYSVADDVLGLRMIPRSELDVMLAAAQCTVVDSLRNEHFDSYVLSESSLFVYPAKVVLKTCGTTRLLEAVAPLLDAAARVDMLPHRCKYTRGTFMFPQVQPAPYRSFEDEVKELDRHFGHLGAGGSAYVMGDVAKFPNWHVYVADAKGLEPLQEPTYTLEMCMTKLDRAVAAQFYQDAGFSAAKDVTAASGIGSLLPGSAINDFSFEPCGYSMNGIEMGAHSTVHITPEDGFSYASFETEGYGDAEVDLNDLVARVCQVFRPGAFSVAVYVDGGPGSKGAGTWGGALLPPAGYSCQGTARQDLPFGSCTAFHTFSTHAECLAVVAPIPLFTGAALLRKEEAGLAAGKELAGLAGRPSMLAAPGEWAAAYKGDITAKYGTTVTRAMDKFAPHLIGGDAGGVDIFMRGVVEATDPEAAFYVMDLGAVLNLWSTWTKAMPRVVPFYAVKCNPDRALLALLEALGSGFDVASKAEIALCQDVGVAASRMIFANPCKLPSHIVYAADAGLMRTTFDSESELRKLKRHHPTAHAVLRLRCDDRGARCPLGVKYGAEFEDCRALLEAAHALGVHVAGVAFHVGSGAVDPASYTDGIAMARELFDIAAELGMPSMTFLDVGGGFTSEGGGGVSFARAAAAINEALEHHFPPGCGVDIIGEPGRFFAEAPVTLATHVFGTRFRGSGPGRAADYWINDGIYGSMNCLLFDHAELTAHPLATATRDRVAAADGGQKLMRSTVFGPTCDGLDVVLRDVWLPQLDNGDWLIFPRMGAYTAAAGTSFNGFATSDIETHYVYLLPPEAGAVFDEAEGKSEEGCYEKDSDPGSDSGDLSGDSSDSFPDPCEDGSGSDDDGF